MMKKDPFRSNLIGAQTNEIVEAAKRIEKFTSVIDLNFSGPIQRVVNKGQGAACLKNPDLIAEMVGAVVENVSVPVTAKIRIGIQGNDVDVLKIAKNICQFVLQAIVPLLKLMPY